MVLGVSGTGSLKNDLKVAKQISSSWVNEDSGMQKVNSKISDQSLMIPKWVLDRCYGICFLFITRAGFVWSGELGTGFVIAKINKGTPQERWSAPTAVTSGGMGYGAQIGGAKLYHVVVLNSKNALRTFTSKGKMNFGADVGVAAGPIGRAADVKLDAGTKGVAASYSYSYTQGAFAGIALNGAVVVSNSAMNKTFFGRSIKPTSLLAGIEGLQEADGYHEYQSLHRNLSLALGGGPGVTPPQSSADLSSQRSQSVDVDYFGLGGRSQTVPASMHAGADTFQRGKEPEATPAGTQAQDTGSYNDYLTSSRSVRYPAIEAGPDSYYGARNDGAGSRDDGYGPSYRGPYGDGYAGYSNDPYYNPYDRAYDDGYGRRDNGYRREDEAPRSGYGRDYDDGSYATSRRDDTYGARRGSRNDYGGDYYPSRI